MEDVFVIAPVKPRILAIDPGSVSSGCVLFDPVCEEPVVYAAKVDNTYLVNALRSRVLLSDPACVEVVGPHVLVVEMMRARGMPFSNEEMRTLVWLGRFIEAWGGEYREIYRQDVKLHLCGSAKARDANIRAALIDRFGGKDRAIGCKRAPGPLYAVKADAWSALALAATYAERGASNEVNTAPLGAREVGS